MKRLLPALVAAAALAACGTTVPLTSTGQLATGDGLGTVGTGTTAWVAGRST